MSLAATAHPSASVPIEYDDDIVRMFVVATLFWGVVGMGMGVFIAAQMVFPELNLGLAQLSLPTKGAYAAERVWVQRIDPARARILSVVRYGAPCQFGDVVLCDEGPGQTGFCDCMALSGRGRII